MNLLDVQFLAFFSSIYLALSFFIVLLFPFYRPDGSEFVSLDFLDFLSSISKIQPIDFTISIKLQIEPYFNLEL